MIIIIIIIILIIIIMRKGVGSGACKFGPFNLWVCELEAVSTQYAPRVVLERLVRRAAEAEHRVLHRIQRRVLVKRLSLVFVQLQ